MQDKYDTHASGLESPATDAFAITPSDTQDLPQLTRALYVGGGGAAVVVLKSGAEVAFANLAAGSVLPARLRRVKATGTTATGLVAMI